MIPTAIPHGRTARRLQWGHLPPHLRSVVERRCGAPVVEARSQDAGFTPGFASVLSCADGSRHFVKAASTKAQRVFADAYREEARKLRALPPQAPAARLRWVHDADEWVVLGFEPIAGRPPHRPWRTDDLAVCLETLADMTRLLTPAPPLLRLRSFAEEFEGLPALWDQVRRHHPDLPHAEDAAALAGQFAAVTAGRTLVHTDVRDDNLLIRPDGTAVLCDWNWPVVGAAWIDTVMLLIGPRGDGLDVETVLAEAEPVRSVPAEHVDVLLAVLGGYFLKSADDPVPPTSPYLREAQRWQGEVVWDWLCERRGWAGPTDRAGSDLGGPRSRC